MLFRITEELLEAQPSVAQLSTLLHLANSRGHRVIFERPTGEAAKAFIAAQGEALRAEWMASVRASEVAEARSASTQELSIVAGASDFGHSKWKVSLDDAVTLVDLSFHLLVENGDTDRGFLYAMSNAQLSADLGLAERSKALHIYHCGGVTQLLPRAKALIEQTPLVRHRMAALVDSDCAVPEHPHASTLRARQDLLELGITVFQLRRRAIENYLTVAALEQWIPTRGADRHGELHGRLAEFRVLAAPARNSIHLKDGLQKDRRLFEGHADALSNYPNLTAQRVASFVAAHYPDGINNRQLRRGFGSDVSDIYTTQELRKAITQLDLTAGSQQMEMIPILRSILAMARQ